MEWNVSKKWKQPKHLSTDGWINKCRTYIQWNIAQQQNQRNEALTPAAGWTLDPESVTLVEAAHTRPLIVVVLFSCQVVSDSLWPQGLQHTRLTCPSPFPGVCPRPCPLNRWCHQTISSSVAPFSCPQSFPASGSFPVSWLLTSGDQSIGASASVLPMNIQGWLPLGLTGLIFLQSKGLSNVFYNTTIEKHQFVGSQTSLWSNSHICAWLQKKP